MIKPFTIRDAVLVANLQKQGITLNLEERLIHPYSPLRAALIAYLLPTMSGISTYILNISDESGHYQGLAQTRTRRGRPEEDVIFLAPLLKSGQPAKVTDLGETEKSQKSGRGNHAHWQRLLNHICVKAGEAGHHRVYARLDSDGDEAQVFKNIGFSPYAEERIFKLDMDAYTPLAKQPLRLRKQAEVDSWSLQRLYTAVTPQGVQMAEGLAQGLWQISRYPVRRYGYVWESDGEVLAVMNFHSGKSGHWFKLMVHPDVRDKAVDLILSGLSAIKSPHKYPIYCSLRTYQTELTPSLVDCGFEQFARRLVLVKHITVRARDFLSRLLPAFDAVVEAKPVSPSAAMQVETRSVAKINGNSNQTSGSFTA